jgi:CRP-like cAMP-binding protein
MRWTESDLRFIVETVATRRRDHDHIIALVRDKDDLLEPMLDDPRLAERLLSEQEAFLRVSPRLMFAVLLRRVRRDLEQRGFVLEVDERGKRLPVFQAGDVRALLEEPTTRDYLVEMLCSFVRTNTAVLYWRDARGWRKRKISDINLDDMVALCHWVEPEFRGRVYKRIGDIALFLTGIYPDHAGVFVHRPRTFTRAERTIADYERDGKRFYALAARHPEPPWTTAVFEQLAERFTLARHALNTLSDTYLKPLRSHYFATPASGETAG